VVKIAHSHVVFLLSIFDFVNLTILVFNTIFNNISVISWQSVLLGDETGILGEYRRPATNHCQTLSHKVAFTTIKYIEKQ
jgi:hypothetical protein